MTMKLETFRQENLKLEKFTTVVIHKLEEIEFVDVKIEGKSLHLTEEETESNISFNKAIDSVNK